MGEGVINSPSGAKVHESGATAGVIHKDKSGYTKSNHQLHLKKQVKKSYVNDSKDSISVSPTCNNSQPNYQSEPQKSNYDSLPLSQNRGSESAVNSNISSRFSPVASSSIRYTNVSSVRLSKYANNNYNAIKQMSENSSFKKTTNAQRIKEAVTDTSAIFNNRLETFQNPDSGVSVNKTLTKTGEQVIDKADKFIAKSSKSRYFRVSKKASESVKVTAHTSRFIKATAGVKKAGKVGVSVVKGVSSPIVSVAGNSNDIGSETINKAISSIPYVVKGVRLTKNTTEIVAKGSYKAVRYTAEKSVKTVKKASKYAKSTVTATRRVARATTRVAIETAKATAFAVKKIATVIVSNPLISLVGGMFVFVFLLLIMMCTSAMSGTVQGSSYGGTGNENTMTLNSYSAVYDYINQAITQRNLELYNLQDSYTGYLEYHYKYLIKQDDGTVINSDFYPVADVSPIMAYLSVTYQTYTLSPTLKNEINTIVEQLYTFSYAVEPCQQIIIHGDDNVEVINGEKITFTITYNNPAKFFENNGYIPVEKLSVYASVKDFGDRAYFRLFNILNDKNWHEFILYPYGHAIKTTYNYETDRFEYEMIQQEYCTLSYRNIKGETAGNIHSPINGVVKEIKSTDDYNKVITLYDSINNLEVVIMARYDDYINLEIAQNNTVTAGQKIATHSYQIDIICKSGGQVINPMLLMEYYDH